MTKIKTDTTIYNSLVNDFNTSVNNYNQAIDSFFTDIANSTAWAGEASDKYKEMALLDKVNYTNFGESLSKFVNVLYDMSASIENTASRTGR